MTEAGVTTYYAYDRTDEIAWKGPNQNGSGSSTFVYDSLGQLVSSYPSVPDASGTVPTTYAYDPAGHLSQIGAGGHVTSFGIDALGRHASQQVDGGAVTTYGYLGVSNTISAQTTSGNTTYSGIDAIGDRITTTEGAASVYVIPDLHGNVVATADVSGSPVFLSAYRYDAYGETCAAYLAGSLTSDSNPWRFQGRILESTSGQTDLYDFGARSYDPSLGAFTSFDSVAGSAQNPLTLNRYLYANANPETLVDPDGHLACGGGLDPLSAAACEAINAPAVAAARQSVQCGGGLPPSMAQACETHKAAVVSNARAKAGTGPTLKEMQEAAERARVAAAPKPAAPAAPANQGCDWNPFSGNSCVGQAANSVNQAVQDAARGAVDFVEDNAATLALAATLVGCGAIAVGTVGAGALVTAACYAYVLGAGAGMLGYAGSTVAGNAAAGNWGDLGRGFDLSQMSIAGLAGGTSAAACVVAPGVGCYAGGAATSAAQYGLATGRNPVDDLPGYAVAALSGGVLAGRGPDVTGGKWGSGMLKGGAVVPIADFASNVVRGLGCRLGLGQC